MNYVLKSNIYADKERILGQDLKSLRVLYFLSQNKQIWKSNTKYKYFSNFQIVTIQSQRHLILIQRSVKIKLV